MGFALQIPSLTKRNLAQLVGTAKRMGVPPEDYAKRLVVDGLALQREAEEASFAEIMEPVRKAAGTVDEAEVLRLVGKARKDHHRGSHDRRKR